jgi:hypothetical protein
MGSLDAVPLMAAFKRLKLVIGDCITFLCNIENPAGSLFFTLNFICTYSTVAWLFSLVIPSFVVE